MNTRYIVQRLLTAVVVLLGVTFVVFLIMQLVPGDPARVILGVQANEENVAALRELFQPTSQDFVRNVLDGEELRAAAFPVLVAPREGKPLFQVLQRHQDLVTHFVVFDVDVRAGGIEVHDPQSLLAPLGKP